MDTRVNKDEAAKVAKDALEATGLKRAGAGPALAGVGIGLLVGVPLGGGLGVVLGLGLLGLGVALNRGLVRFGNTN